MFACWESGLYFSDRREVDAEKTCGARVPVVCGFMDLCSMD